MFVIIDSIEAVSCWRLLCSYDLLLISKKCIDILVISAILAITFGFHILYWLNEKTHGSVQRDGDRERTL